MSEEEQSLDEAISTANGGVDDDNFTGESGRKLVRVKKSLRRLEALLAMAAKAITRLEEAGGEIEASIINTAKKELDDLAEKAKKLADDAAKDASDSMNRSFEAASARLNNRISKIEARLLQAEEALADEDPEDDDGTLDLTTLEGGAADAKGENLFSKTAFAQAGSTGTPRLQKLIEDNEHLSAEVVRLKKTTVWLQRFCEQLCRAEQISFTELAARVDAMERSGTPAPDAIT